MTNKHTLLINEPFALRQRNGEPVFTNIKTIEKQRTEIEIDNAINNLNRQILDAGLTYSKQSESKYRKEFKEIPKKIRIKTDYPIDLHTIERIILTPNAKGYISTYFIEFAKEHNIAIYWVDAKNKIDASFIPFNFKKPQLAIKQYEAISNGKNFEIARYIVRLKLESQEMTHYPTFRRSKQ